MADFEPATPEVDSSIPTPAPVPVEAPAPTAGADPAAPTEEQPKPDAKPERTFTQQEVDKLLSKRLAREARRLEREISDRIQRELPRPAPERRADASAESSASGKPELKNFASYEDWVEAVADWRADQKIQSRIQAETEKARKLDEARTVQERQRYFRERVVDKGAEAYDDFEDVVLNDRLTITDPMALTIAEMDQGHVVAYYLGEHPEEAARIAQLSSPQQVRELDKIAATLFKPAAPTKAPEPIKPNAATGSVEQKLEAAPMADFIKIRRRQLAQKGA